MFYSNQLHEIRAVYIEAWNKQAAFQALSPLEQLICSILNKHPEYHRFIKDTFSDAQFTENNPFLHLGLHIALAEQLSCNRPFGIQKIYQDLLKKHLDPHRVEHLMMNVLEDILWQAQTNQVVPDEQAYLKACQELAGSS